MLLTQRMTPSRDGPGAAEMMTLMMPLMLGVISWTWQRACALLVRGHLIALAQQAIIEPYQPGERS